MSEAPNPGPRTGTAWRMIEAQNQISTMKLVDNTDEQFLLEALLEDTKPPVPQECQHLNYLLFTPFRYSKYPSRFRRAGDLFGVFYAAENVETALAEIVFHRLLRLADAPTVPWPTNPVEFTAFAINFETAKCLDLTTPPHDTDAAKWERHQDYSACQDIGAQAHKDGVEVIRSKSLRDASGLHNISLISCAAFADPGPVDQQNWHIRFSSTGVQARSREPARAVTYPPGSFADDTRMQDYQWDRPN